MLMDDRHDDFTPQEVQERFEATLRGALKVPPQHRETPQKPVTSEKKRGAYAHAASRATAKIDQSGT
jgi:hypothetical protein